MNQRAAHRRTRRGLDLLLVCASAPLWVPVLGCIGLAVLATSSRPVFFVQTRLGQDAHPFQMIKFRTMLNGDNPLIPAADRITPIGRVLRRTSLDELPQLINVLRGDMSLVGPRPMLPQHANSLNPSEHARFVTKPGMTGLAQINGRNSIQWSDRIAYDIEWCTAPTISSYLSILRQTAGVVTTGDGVEGHDPSDPLHVDLVAQTTTVDLTQSETNAKKAA